MLKIILSLLPFSFAACQQFSYNQVPETAAIGKMELMNIPFDSSAKTIHVFTALCDNKYQGIVPVPAKIGNGQDPDNNLYWGCAYGMRSYFKNSKNWTFIKGYRIDSIKFERIIFKHKKENYYLVADAYNGKYIRQCTLDFLKSCAGLLKDTLHLNKKITGICGNAKLLAYTGHDGLMDFQLPENFSNKDSIVRDAIVLACMSKRYFSPYLKQTGARPLLWSTNLMSPEAYTLHDALELYIKDSSPEMLRTAAARSYSRYQKCSERAARNLLITGW
ncbi:MAG: hypothetical protein WAT19_04910 [Ferruginibacter sp.]